MRRMRRGPVVTIAAIALIALLVPVLPLPDPVRIDVAHQLAPPSWSHWLGQDEYGRDVLARLLWGARTSLVVAAASASLACLFGTLLGLTGGFLRGVTELLAVRSMDVVLCFPPLLLALLIVTLLGPGASTLIPVLAVLYLPGFVRVVYAGVLSVRVTGLRRGDARTRRQHRCGSCCAPFCPTSPDRYWCSSASPRRRPLCWNPACRFSASALCRRRRPGA